MYDFYSMVWYSIRRYPDDSLNRMAASIADEHTVFCDYLFEVFVCLGRVDVPSVYAWSPDAFGYHDVDDDIISKAKGVFGG